MQHLSGLCIPLFHCLMNRPQQPDDVKLSKQKIEAHETRDLHLRVSLEFTNISSDLPRLRAAYDPTRARFDIISRFSFLAASNNNKQVPPDLHNSASHAALPFPSLTPTPPLVDGYLAFLYRSTSSAE